MPCRQFGTWKIEKKILNKILEDMSGLSETAEKHIERRNNLRKELETEQDKETFSVASFRYATIVSFP